MAAGSDEAASFIWPAEGRNMDSAYVPALAAFGGSAVGGLTSLVASWVTQRRKDTVRSLAQEKARRQNIQAIHR